MSFLPAEYQHPYQIHPKYQKSVAYFSSEFAIDQTLKIYSGGLGFLAGSHMRSAYDQQQNTIGIGILWSYGYYSQIRGENREMAVQHQRNNYHFLRSTGIRYKITVHEADVWVEAKYLPGDIFGTCPMFLLTTDIDGNDDLSRSISRNLYDSDPMTRIAQYILLGVGGAKLLDELNVEPDVYHMNEAHALSAAFYKYSQHRDLEKLKNQFVFTTHTPEEAGNEKSDFHTLERFSFFSGLSGDEAREITGIHDHSFNHSLASLRLSGKSNAVSKLHGDVSRKMWGSYQDICEITHITNAQNKKFWVDAIMESARVKGDLYGLRARKRERKARLFREVADQTGKIFDPDICTIVWARRFAGYKRADLIARDREFFRKLLNNTEQPVQIIWAGKPYPKDYGAIDLFNELIHFTNDIQNATVLVGYELALSKLLKDGSDIWLNTPVVTREASGTSGMTAAMNGSLNLSTLDGWVCEFAQDGKNSFIVPNAEEGLTVEARDRRDMLALHHVLENKALPLYYKDHAAWLKMMLQSMNDVAPAFDSDRMVNEYYAKLY